MSSFAGGSRSTNDSGDDIDAVSKGAHRRRHSEMGDDEDSPSRQRRKPPQPPPKILETSPLIQEQQIKQQGQIKQQEQHERQPRSPLRAFKTDVVAEMDAEKSKKLLEWELSTLREDDLRSHAWFHGYRVDRLEAERLLNKYVIHEHGIDTKNIATAHSIESGEGERELKKNTENDSNRLVDENGMTELSKNISVMLSDSLVMRQRCRMDGIPPAKKSSISNDRRQREFYCFLVRNSRNLNPPGRYVMSCLRVDNLYEDDYHDKNQNPKGLNKEEREKLLLKQIPRSNNRQSIYPVLHFVINEIILQPGTVYERSQFTFGDTLSNMSMVVPSNSNLIKDGGINVHCGQCKSQPGFDSVPDLIRYYVGGADKNAFLLYGPCTNKMESGRKNFDRMHEEVRIRYPCNRNIPLMMNFDEANNDSLNGEDYTRLVRQHSQTLAAVAIINKLLSVPRNKLIEKASAITSSFVDHHRRSPPILSHDRRRQHSPPKLPSKSDKTHGLPSVRSSTLRIPSETKTSVAITTTHESRSSILENQGFVHNSIMPRQSTSSLSMSTSLPSPSGSFNRPSVLLHDPSTSSLDLRFKTSPELSNERPSTSGLSSSNSHFSTSLCQNPLLNEALNMKSYESSSSFSIFDAIPNTSSTSRKYEPEIRKNKVSGVIDMDAEIAAALFESEKRENNINMNMFTEFDEPKPIVVRSSFAHVVVYNYHLNRSESRQSTLNSYQSRFRSSRVESINNSNKLECFQEPRFKKSSVNVLSSCLSSDFHVNKQNPLDQQQLCPPSSIVVPLTSTLQSEKVIDNEQKSIVLESQKQDNRHINMQEILEAENMKNSKSIVKKNMTLIQENQSQVEIKNVEMNSQKDAEKKQMQEQSADMKIKMLGHNSEIGMNHNSDEMNSSFESYSYVDLDISDTLNDQQINTYTISHRLVGSLKQLHQMRSERLHQTWMRIMESYSRKHSQSQLLDCSTQNNVTKKPDILKVLECSPNTSVSMEYSPSSITFQGNLGFDDVLIRKNGEGTLTKNSDDAEPNTYTIIADHKSSAGEHSYSRKYQPPTDKKQSPPGVFKMWTGEYYSPTVELQSSATKRRSQTVSHQSLIMNRQSTMEKPKSLEEESQLQTERLQSMSKELPSPILELPSPTEELHFTTGNNSQIRKNVFQNRGNNHEALIQRTVFPIVKTTSSQKKIPKLNITTDNYSDPLKMKRKTQVAKESNIPIEAHSPIGMKGDSLIDVDMGLYPSLEVKDNSTTVNEEHLSTCIIQTSIGRTLGPDTARTFDAIPKCRTDTYDQKKENCTVGLEKIDKITPNAIFGKQTNRNTRTKTCYIYGHQVINKNNDNKECCDLCGNKIISTVDYENTNSPGDFNYENICVEKEEKYCQESQQRSISNANGHINSIAYALRSIHLTIIGNLEDSGETVSVTGTARLAAALCQADGHATVLPYHQHSTENDEEKPGEPIPETCPLQLLGHGGPKGRRARLDIIERFSCLQYLVAITVIVTPCLVLIGDDISSSENVANANKNWSVEDEYEYQKRRFYYECAGAGGMHLLDEDSSSSDDEDNYEMPVDYDHSFGHWPVSKDGWAVERFHWLEALTRLRAAALDKWIRTAADVKQAVGDVYGYRALMSALCSDRIQSLQDVWASLRQLHTTTAVTFESRLRPEFFGHRDKNLNDETVHSNNEDDSFNTDVFLELPPNVTVPDATIVSVLYEQMYNDDIEVNNSNAAITALSSDNIRNEGTNSKSMSLITSPLLLLPSACWSPENRLRGIRNSAIDVLGINDIHAISIKYTLWIKQNSDDSCSTTSLSKPPMLQLDQFRNNFRTLLNQYGFGDNEDNNNYNDDFIHDDYQSESNASFRDRSNRGMQESFPYERFYEDQIEQYENFGIGDYDDDEDDNGTIICNSNQSSIAKVSNTDRHKIKVDEMKKKITTENSHSRRCYEEDRYCRWINAASTSRLSPAPLNIVFRTELHGRLFWPPSLHLLDSSDIDCYTDYQKIVPAYALGTTYAALAAINCGKEGKEDPYNTQSSLTLNQVINTQLDQAIQDMRLRYTAMEEFLDGACDYSSSVAKSVYAKYIEADK